MKITLIKKHDVGDRDPLLVQYLEGPEGKQTKKTMTVKIGETLEVADDLAIELMQKYRGLFVMGDAKDYAHKAARPTAGARSPHAAEG